MNTAHLKKIKLSKYFILSILMIFLGYLINLVGWSTKLEYLPFDYLIYAGLIFIYLGFTFSIIILLLVVIRLISYL